MLNNWRTCFGVNCSNLRMKYLNCIYHKSTTVFK